MFYGLGVIAYLCKRGVSIILTENLLTTDDLISYLLAVDGGEKMIGIIRSKGKCPVGQCKFEEVHRIGFICSVHKTVPCRFYIDLFFKGQRIRLFSDGHGQPIDTYQRALNLLSHINYEIKNYTFEPSKYVKQELEKFYVSSLLDKFLAFKLDAIAPSYRKDYRRYIKLARDFFTTKDARELRKIDVINYKEYLEKNFNLSGKTVKNIFDNFKTFLHYLRDDLEIIDMVPVFPVVETLQPKIRWLTTEVQRCVFENIPEDDKPIFSFLMLSGCRPGEARALKCRDVDLDQGIINISSTFSGRVYREKRKGRNSKSVVIPIHPEILHYIKSRVESNLSGAYLFINLKTGLYYSENKLRKIWNRVRERVELDKSIRLYDATRHSFASQLINKGVPLLSVSRLLGHSSTKMTERYAHSDLGRLKIDISNLSLKEATVTRLSPVKKSAL